MNESYFAAQRRWDTFLEKISTRFHELLSQTETLLPNVIELEDFDPTPFSVAWQGIESQAKDLMSKVQHTWQEQLSPMLEQIKEDGEDDAVNVGRSLDDYYIEYDQYYNLDRQKGRDIENQLTRELKNYEVRTFASAARKLQFKASEVLSKNFLCSQCKAPLELKQNFYRSYYLTCTYCQTVNTFEPGTIARNVEHFALHALAEENSLAAYFHYLDLENKFREQNSEDSIEVSSETLLKAYKVYAEQYLKTRIEIIPELKNNYEKDLASKVERIRKLVIEEFNYAAETNNDENNEQGN
jgi:hypothetical protein